MSKFEKVREITEADARLYSKKVILANLDNGGLDFSQTLLFVQQPVKVRNDIGELIGHAAVWIENYKLIAHITINYHTPERFAAEVPEGVRNWAHVKGELRVEANEYLNTGLQKVKGIVVDEIVLSSVKPTDDRLYPFGEDVL